LLMFSGKVRKINDFPKIWRYTISKKLDWNSCWRPTSVTYEEGFILVTVISIRLTYNHLMNLDTDYRTLHLIFNLKLSSKHFRAKWVTVIVKKKIGKTAGKEVVNYTFLRLQKWTNQQEN
jgi:hypothetical protein